MEKTRFSKTPKELKVPKLYQKADGGFHYKFTINGKPRVVKKLDAITKTMAKKEAEHKQAAHNAARNGLLDSNGLPYADPFAVATVDKTTCGAIRDAWKAAGYPSFGTVPQPLQAEKREQYLQVMNHAVNFFENTPAERLTIKLSDNFFTAMLKGKPTSYARTVDKSLSKLSALLTWAVRREIIKKNPIRTKVKQFVD